MGLIDPTPNGTYVIGEKHASMIMDSSTYGVAVDSAVAPHSGTVREQMSYSGIFIHAAPWSVWAQTSVCRVPQHHRQTQVVLHSGATLKSPARWAARSGWDGLGDWNIPWETWKAGNADRVPLAA